MNGKELFDSFEDIDRAQMLIRELIEPLLGSFDERGKPYSAEELHSIVLTVIADTPSPDKTLLNIHRMAEASFGISFTRDLVRYPVLIDLAVKIASSSQFLSDIIVRDPELFRWLTTTDVLSRTKSRQEYSDDLKKQVALFEKHESQINAIRRTYRREILRIGVRDILELDSFESIVREISDLADAISATVLEVAMNETIAKYKAAPRSKLVIIGLGKLGGRELNYSSDVDVMFIVDDDTAFTTPEGRSVQAVDFYSSVVDKWIAHITGHSGEGTLYRVDTRLRPDGDAGPLVRSVQSCTTYYETRGELWERQMLIKARPIAGDIELGDFFISTLQPFIYPATFFQSPRKTIARMKSRIEKRLEDPDNIKLCRGGIRDIEFIVQALQLLNGGKEERIRTPSTLAAIELLFGRNYLNRRERDILRDAYIFFRNLEHRVQLDDNIQTHSIPAETGKRTQFARTVGCNSADEFDEVLDKKRSEVIKIFDGVFGEDNDPADVEAMFGNEKNVDLKRYGFVNEKRARELFNQLAFGISSAGIGEHDMQTREMFRKIAPSLLDNFASTINPDRALTNFLSIVREYPHPHSLYVMFQHEAMRKALITLCGYSNKLSLQLAKYPEDLELLFTNAAEILETNYLDVSDINRFTDRFLYLAVHMRYCNGRSNLEEVHHLISYIAVKKIRTVLNEIYREKGIDDPPVAIMALGKLSGEELGPGADLDLIFFFDACNDFDAATAETIARELIRRAAASGADTIPFEVDMRLRPEGESAPLAVEVATYNDYLQGRASFWERQSLTRAKMIAGKKELVNRIEGIVEQYVYDSPLSDGWIDQLKKMRYRTESRSRMNRHDFINFKTGTGGIMDIEFLVQAIQLYYGKMDKAFRSTSTREILSLLHKLDLIGIDDADYLSRAYSDFRQLEYFNRIYLEDPSNLVPSGFEEQKVLQKVLNITEDPLKYFRERTAKVRNMFERVIQEGENWKSGHIR